MSDEGANTSTGIDTTVRWSNFDRWDPKMGVFWLSTEATPANIFLNERLPLKTPTRTPCSWPPWPWFTLEKSFKIFKVSWKIRNYDPHFKNLYLARKWVWTLKCSYWSCLKACFKGYYFTTLLVGPCTGAQRSHERAPRNVQMTLND